MQRIFGFTFRPSHVVAYYLSLIGAVMATLVLAIYRAESAVSFPYASPSRRSYRTAVTSQSAARHRSGLRCRVSIATPRRSLPEPSFFISEPAA